jgi:flagellar biosynthesis GTPase FlhF
MLPKQNKSITVLLVGETQQGKSTLIQKLHAYADAPINIGIGTGDSSCTTAVGIYPLAIPLRKFKLVSTDETDLHDYDFADLCDLGTDEAEIAPEQTPEEKVDFILVDTPGLDDSMGNDMENMAGIISKVGELDHLNAVVYIRKGDKPFSPVFREFFHYLDRSMPAICNGLIVVNTFFSVDYEQQHFRNNKDAKKIRKDGFKATVGRDLVHFFIDNRPSKYSPFARVQSLNELYNLLSHLRTQKPLQTSELKLLKTPKMKEFEQQILLQLKTLQSTLEKRWDEKKAAARDAEQNAMNIQRQETRIKSKIDQQRKMIREFENGSEVLLGTRSLVDEFSLIDNLLIKGEYKLGSRTIEYDADCTISSVTKWASSGTKWLGEHLQGTHYRVNLSAKWFRDINGSVTFYAKSSDKYRDKINAIKDTCKVLQEEVSILEATHKASGVNLSSDVVTLERDLEKCQQVSSQIESDTCDMTLYQVLRPLYGTKWPVSFAVVLDFVQAYNPEVEILLRKI